MNPERTVGPGYGDALEEDDEEKTHAAGCVRIKQLEHVHSSLKYQQKLLYLVCLGILCSQLFYWTKDHPLLNYAYYRAHTKYHANVMFSAFLSFCSQEGGVLSHKVFMPGLLSQKVPMPRG